MSMPIEISIGLPLGHASIQMTADTYGHLFSRGDDSSELAAAEKVFLAG
jgi:integrase